VRGLEVLEQFVDLLAQLPDIGGRLDLRLVGA
jgi:hypothetical protein